MKSYTAFGGLVFCLMIASSICRPQYNYNVGYSGSAIPSFNTGFVGSLPAGGLLQNANFPNANMQIVRSQPLAQSYIPPISSGQQSFKDISQLPLQQQNNQNAFNSLSAGVALNRPNQNTFPTLSSNQQSVNDISQLPLQKQNLIQSVSAAPGINAQSQTFASQSGNFNHHIGQPQRKTIITKDIYVHTAPQEAEDDIEFKRQLESIPIRKNYRIIFIKAPSQNIRVAAEALKQAQAINEERTVIYVLSKKADIADLQRQITEVQGTQTVNRKPEVFFIKYKTNEEAQRAQQQIQAQYDALGGTTNISDEGFAPITSVIGSLGPSGSSTVNNGGQTGSIGGPGSIKTSGGENYVGGPRKLYLPPA